MTPQPTSTDGIWRSYLWPRVDTPERAQDATKPAFLVAVVSAVLPAGSVVFGSDARQLIDAGLFGLIAFGLWKQSRAAAWAGLVLDVIGRASWWSQTGIPRDPFFALVIPAIVLWAYLVAIRGTCALHRMKKAAAQQSKDVATVDHQLK